MHRDGNIFFVAQSVPEIYGKTKRLKNRGDVFFCYRLYMYLLVLIHPFSIGSNETFFRHLFQKHRLCFRIRSVINQPKQEQTKPPAHSDSISAMIVLLALRTGRKNSDAPHIMNWVDSILS